MGQRLRSMFIAFCFIDGVVLGTFADNVVPLEHLWRPLAVGVVASMLVGAASRIPTRHASTVAAVISLGIFLGNRLYFLIFCGFGVVVLLMRIAPLSIDAESVVLAMAAGFLIAGVARAVGPAISSLDRDVASETLSRSLEAGTLAQSDKPDSATYVILMDGYPRADTLAGLGVDISSFVDGLEARGLKVYPDARSQQSATFRSLSALLVGYVEGDGPINNSEKWRHRSMWRLPSEFVTVAPWSGHVTIPDVPNVGPFGITDFETRLLGQTVVGPWVKDWVMDQLRRYLDGALDVLEVAEHRWVFAHLLVPHPPYLYEKDGEASMPQCWPACSPFAPYWDREKMEATLEYLNQRILSVVDHVQARFPDARIVLLSDHGGRFTDDPDEAYRIFLASNVPLGDSPTLVTVNQAVFNG